jgi:hypothetical protein
MTLWPTTLYPDSVYEAMRKEEERRMRAMAQQYYGVGPSLQSVISKVSAEPPVEKSKNIKLLLTEENL